MEKSALIGYSGFVGSTLLNQRKFTDLYRSTNIIDIRSKSYDLVICAGAPAKKWLANKDPVSDELVIDNLISHLQSVKAKKFILISTVDVFKSPQGVKENSEVLLEGLHAYGRNRFKLEEFVKCNFKNHLIIRLPGLVGRGLRKNIIFDFLNGNNLERIDSRNVFQFYPMQYLCQDINRALELNLDLLHLTAAPLTVEEVAELGFGICFKNKTTEPVVRYDMETKYASYWGSESSYQYSKKDSLDAIKSYARTEKRIVHE